MAQTRDEAKNLLVLDFANVYDNTSLIEKNRYVLDIDNILRNKHNMPLRGSSQLQPYLRNKEDISFPVTLEFEFFCKDMLTEDIELVLENAKYCSIFINDNSISNQSCNYWCDPALEKVPVNKNLIKIGTNKIKLKFNYTSDFSGIESIYLLGNFGIENKNTLTKAKDAFAGISLTEQNYPFYSGNTTYPYTFYLDKEEDCQIKLKNWQGSAISIKLDNLKEEIFLTSPDLQTYAIKLSKGKHQLFITVYGNRRNAFGPFYCERFFWIGPYEFTTTKLKEKEIVTLGLLEDPEVLLA